MFVRNYCSKSNRQCHQVHVPLPLPKQLVVFSLGEWRFLSSETTISVDVLVSQDVKPQRIGTLSDQTRYIRPTCVLINNNCKNAYKVYIACFKGAWLGREIGMLTLSKRQQRKGGEEYMGRFCSLFVERYGFKRFYSVHFQCYCDRWHFVVTSHIIN